MAQLTFGQKLAIGIEQQANNAQYFYNYAKICKQDGDLADALESVHQALEYDANDPNILYLAATLYKETENHEKALYYEKLALTNFEKGHYFKVSPYFLYHDYGVSNMMDKNYKTAHYCFNTALHYKITPQCVFNRGNAKLYLKDYDGACQDWKIAQDNGISYANQLLKTWCKNCNYNDSTKQQLRVIEKKYIDYYPPGKDTLKVAIYYNYKWSITHERSKYYRIANWIYSQQQFEGPFTDYFTANKMSEGSYQNGKLHGAFKSFYGNGKLLASGAFKNGHPDGTWVLFHWNEAPWLVIDFKEGDYDIRECYDQNGKPTLKDGTGKWFFHTNIGSRIKCSGYYKNHKKVKQWSVINDTYCYKYTEIYNRKGKLRKVKTHKGNSIQPDFYRILTGLQNEWINQFYVESDKVIDKYSFINFVQE